MNIYTEVTPNPASLKFRVGKMLLSNGTAFFEKPEEAEGRSDLATLLFKYPFVEGVMISQDFVTVTKTEEAKWEDLIPVVKNEIKSAIERGDKIVDGQDNFEARAGESELEQKIRQLIDEQVRPAVAMDGGDIVYEGFNEGVVKLQLRGSCSGCPSSIVTLKQGIQSLLQRMVPEVKEVEAV